MLRRRGLMLVVTLLALGAGCGDKLGDDTDDSSGNGGDTSGGGSNCTCEDDGVSLAALSGCEDFGGDEEECSGWASCEEENNLGVGSFHEDGTELTCFGCTIRIDCP
ncbi:MAG: hypothetical protein H6741_30250 [Alphaproteobacteria bacterium]|nr:hypothetical protein [Alphaproteobacteria bacterium]